MFTTLIVSAIAVWLTAWFLPGVTVDPWWVAIAVAFVLGLVNSIIRPIVKALALPINIVTLGLFTFVINALMVMLTSWIIGDKFAVDGFWNAMLFSIIVSVVTWFLQLFVKDDK